MREDANFRNMKDNVMGWLVEIAAEGVKCIRAAEGCSTHSIAMGYNEIVFLLKRILTKILPNAKTTSLQLSIINGRQRHRVPFSVLGFLIISSSMVVLYLNRNQLSLHYILRHYKSWNMFIHENSRI